LRVETTGEPAIVLACHCRECQRRTGAPFGVSAYFEQTQVWTEGPSTVYVRDGQEGRKLRLRFCPSCGTTVYWDADRFPGRIGIAVGAFTDPSFPPPTRSVYEETQHPWVAVALTSLKG
jgi:hypothetical protein